MNAGITVYIKLILVIISISETIHYLTGLAAYI